MNRQTQLITYPDSLGGNLRSLRELLEGPLAGLFGGVHVLPPFPSSGDRGFAPVTYREIDPAFGSWDDIRALGGSHEVGLDLMVNHLSRRSPEFRNFLRWGRQSAYADLFLTLEKVWPGGEPAAADVEKIFLRRPKPPFTTFTIEKTGREETVWTTFGRTEPPEHIDLDVQSRLTREMLGEHLAFFRSQNVRLVRLDAVGYVIKKAGASCFMVEPEIWEFLDWLTGVADGLGLVLLPEVHGDRELQRRIAARGYWTYDFVLPLLVLHALLTGSADTLREHIAASPRRQFTMLDCHDGIPAQPDASGVLSVPEIAGVVDHCLARGANLSRLMTASGRPIEPFDAHQINVTYFSALDKNEAAYLLARAIQLFAPGIPQIYYVGLLAGENDTEAAARTGEGRAINRHNYTQVEVLENTRRSVVQRLFDLVRLRNSHPAFDGMLSAAHAPRDELVLEWRRGVEVARLEVRLRQRVGRVTYTTGGGAIGELPIA